ncbi:hypothetical protein DIZ27_38880 [Streptomyces sp. NWU339]|uniref:hypothetical protein n=1 Tax=Streptomyces sp. NWU339 TaxID=2185284 RepID=UPI000D67355B|nr:hypothetical protein [Streptomyces sp. NWU339]PWI05500.1 hypothetical protein DIZ27_38880 [Streptomyces sp. NWU339]
MSDSTDLRPGDLVEGVAAGSTHGTVLRRRLDREPWSGGTTSDGRERTVVSDGRGVDMLYTDTIKIIERAQ